MLGGLAIRIGTHVQAPGRIEASGSAIDVLPRLRHACAQAGVPLQESDDIRRELWRKLVINNGINPLSAITGWDSRRLTRDEQVAPMVMWMMREAAAAARADQVELDETDVAEMFAVIHDLDAIKTSMLVDREHGRPLELEEICGAVLARARRLGQDAPITAMAAALLRRSIWAD